MKRMYSLVLGIAVILGIMMPLDSKAAEMDNVSVNGSMDQAVASGSDICEMVRAKHGSCTYKYYDVATDTHVVETMAMSSAEDRLIVKNPQDQVIADFKVPTGTKHREAVADRLKVDLGQIEWLSGDTEYDRQGFTYEAILLVR